MKKLISTIGFILISIFTYTQNVGISDNTAFNPSFMFHLQPSAAYASDLFSVQNNAGTYYFHVKLNGNVGIGTNPSYTLDVLYNGSDRVARIRNTSNTASANGLLVSTARNASDAYILNLDANGSSKVFIRSDGSVGIGTTTPNITAILDITSNNKGVLLPRMSLTATNNNSPIGVSVVTGLIVYNTATSGVFPNDVTPGYYWWNGQWERFSSNPKPAWYTTGNTGTNPTQYFLGTIDNQPLAIRSNNVERMRITPDGEVIIGGTTPVMAGDLFIASSLAGFDWPVNGYSFNNGGAFYGDIQTGNATNMSVMEIEHYGSGAGNALMAINNSTNAGVSAGTGVYGESSAAVHSGSNYYSNNYAGVYGSGAWGTNQYSFGVVGLVNGTGLRQGGVMGTWWTDEWGALGYKNSAGNAYGLCYVGGSTTTAKGVNHIATSMGMGGYGDLMGGWIRGNIYGLNVSGERYSLYLHGKQFTNDIITILSDVPNNTERIPTYVPTSMTVDVYAKGTATIVNGEANISFDQTFCDVTSDTDPVIVTVTPVGRRANLYIDNSSKGGFRIIDASSEEIKLQPLTFTWIAIGTRKGYENPQNPPELLEKTYESNMDGVMFNESDLQNSALPIWWDGITLRFDALPLSNKQIILKTDISKFYKKKFIK